jgi:hypothetical protein
MMLMTSISPFGPVGCKHPRTTPGTENTRKRRKFKLFFPFSDGPILPLSLQVFFISSSPCRGALSTLGTMAGNLQQFGFSPYPHRSGDYTFSVYF